jgi:hypothetical protein
MKHRRSSGHRKKGGDKTMPVLIRGFVVEGLPVVFDSLQVASEVRFPSAQLITPYLAEEEDQIDETN